MKRFFIFALFTVGLITLISVEANAGNCRIVHRGHYVAPVVVKKAAVIHHDYKHYAYPIYNRSYLEAYDDSYKKAQLQQQQINIELLKSLNLLQQQIQRGYQSPQFDPSKRAEQIPAPRTPGIPQAPPMLPAQDAPQAEHPAVGYFRLRCLRCHTQGSEKGGLAMFDQQGRFFNPTCEQAVEVLRQIKLDKMPLNGPKPTDQEYSQVVDWLTTVNLKGR